MSEDARPWRGKRQQLLLVNAAVDRELEDFARRDASMSQRGSILIGAATVIGAIQFGSSITIWTALQLGGALAAAVLGIIVVFPHAGSGFNARTMWEKTYQGLSEAEVLHHTIRVKLDNLDADEKHLGRRGVLARIGFCFLGASVALALVGVLIHLHLAAGGATAPAPSATPTASTHG